ncbi:NAD(P)H-hydrate dehydratase [Candidatus Daviesbacteria bacterium]|nr:NAD(P)H-hydrate dehydratase [Candidatus Daviesbacteria bacterium]
MSSDKFLVNESLVKKVLLLPNSDSHKGQNGKILIIADSPLFHGAGRLSLLAATETIIGLASRMNDMVYFCSTKENLNFIKKEQESFIGILREEVDNYLKSADVVLVGPGLMREPESTRAETHGERDFSLEITQKVLSSNKKAVLDAGSLQVIKSEDLKNKTKIIITPHRLEMANLFDINSDKLKTSHSNQFSDIQKVAEIVFSIAKEYKITILLKGPVDIIASYTGWLYSPGGNAGMTKGGTGDVLAGVVASLYFHCDDPLEVASAASFILKQASNNLWRDSKWLYNASDLALNISKIIADFL